MFRNADTQTELSGLGLVAVDQLHRAGFEPESEVFGTMQAKPEMLDSLR
ncbi:MAG TPA: hypothetical protein VFR08_11800 [Candidatus Angelobacter sp.]|nr:hypothetical protein [Candidatus Angelobacter sp.]